VQEAANRLMSCLIQQGDLLNAERFCEQTHANLRDIKNGMDQEGDEVVTGAYNFAEIIYQQDDGDLIIAEALARESLRIRTQLYGSNYDRVGMSCMLLALILQDQTKELLKRSLANFIRKEGPDGVNTAVLTRKVCEFCYDLAMMQSLASTKRTQLLLAKSHI
jgi:hypothetical protein